MKINGQDQEPAIDAPVAPPRPIAPRAAAPHTVPPHNSDAPMSLAPQNVNEAPAPAPASPPHAIAPLTRTTALAPAPGPGENGGSGYYVQVTAQKSEEEARASFRGIQAKYASLLGGHKPSFRPKQGGYFGAQVGPFSREGAAHLCKELTTAGGQCFVVKN